MPLPDLIEIVPLDRPVRAEVTVPGSKSITNRALVLAALADGETTLQGALWSEDTQVMVECLQDLGFMVTVTPDPDEACNRTITVYGLGGKVPRGGTEAQPLELFVGNAGTAARFLTAMVCLGEGVYRLHGVPRMHERPQAALFQALRELGYRIASENDRLPALVHGTGPKPGMKCRVSLEESSQFASALLLSGKRGGWKIEMTANKDGCGRTIADVDTGVPDTIIEPDASSGSYFWAVDELFRNAVHCTAEVRVSRWPRSGWQVDAKFPSSLPLPEKISRRRGLGDSIMTAIVIAPFAGRVTFFTDLGRLRLQECERVVALRTELTKCGVEVLEHGDTLTVFPAKRELHGATIETYNDHRMAMCFAILGLKVAGIKIKNPACVKKTFPNFFQKLAAAPPHGLGARILNASGRLLTHEELFAE